MPVERRTSDRRRRVLYTSQHDATPSTAASRREREKLREARQPTKAYGSKVNRRLRGRWFSLVPVRRRSLCIGAAIIASISLVLAYAHYASVTWPALASSPEIARPLRLDRPDSFGRWFACVLLAGSSGASLLIYQLRRYRNDDFRGHYRLWRIVIITLLLTSINALVSAVDWAGSLLDLAFGRRVAFSGYDWLRIVLGLAGVVLAIRLIAEVRRSRWGLVAILVACGFLALPEATKWQLFEVTDIRRWALVTSAPLLGYTSLFLALVGYLRVLYREVRGIRDDQSLAQRWRNYRANMLESEDEKVESERLERKPKHKTRPKRERVPEPVAEDEPSETDETPQLTADDIKTRGKKRRWFGLRAAKAEPDAAESIGSDDTDSDEEESQPKRKKKKRRFSLRLDPDETSEESDDEDVQTESSVEEDPGEDAHKRKRKFGLSWRKKKQQSTKEQEEVAFEEIASGEEESDTSQEAADAQGETDGDYIDEDEIDWSSLSKSERRRLRKKLKRQNRAA